MGSEMCIRDRIYSKRNVPTEISQHCTVVQFPFVNTLSWRPCVEYATRTTTHLDYRGLLESQGNRLFVSLKRPHWLLGGRTELSACPAVLSTDLDLPRFLAPLMCPPIPTRTTLYFTFSYSHLIAKSAKPVGQGGHIDRTLCGSMHASVTVNTVCVSFNSHYPSTIQYLSQC